MLEPNEVDKWARIAFGGNAAVGSMLLIVYPLIFSIIIVAIFLLFR